MLPVKRSKLFMCVLSQSLNARSMATQTGFLLSQLLVSFKFFKFFSFFFLIIPNNSQ